MVLPSGFSISVMTEDEVAVLDDWAAAEGWNLGLSDVRLARQIDPEAFIALRQGDELAGGGTVFSYDGRFGFMGLFIMRADMRRRGLGRILWQWRRDRLLDRLEPGAAIGMDGVYDMVPFYQRGGFMPSYRDLRYQGIATGQSHPDVVDLGAADFDEIDRYDRAHVPASRTAFLRAWMSVPGVHVVGLREKGGLAGYAVARPCRTGFKIGPLFADRADVAVRLLDTLMSRIAGSQVQIDVPEINPAAVAMAGRFGLSMVFGCVRLYHGPKPDLPLHRIFANTSMEFG